MRAVVKRTREASPLARHLAAARKPVKAAEQLADEILMYIVDHGLQPGTRLAPERQMLADTGRARGTLREALRLLESRGVVEVRPGAAGGAFVRQPQPADLGAAITAVLLLEGASMLDVLAAREDMEVAALMRAARRIGPRDLAAMQESVDALREHIADRERFLAEAGRFHAVIHRAAGSPVLRILNEALRATQMASTSDFPLSYRRRVADEHQEIIAALKKGNAALAFDRMRKHVHTSAHSWSARTRAGRPSISRAA
jgi:GntR family transcriptional regulator, transcriptional repressor for pyruvate dehydrogenase complex